MSSIQDKKLKVPKVDLKKKPNYELLLKIGKSSAQDITPHPFTKVKKPREEKIEEIFVKKKSEIQEKVKNNKKPIKKKKVNKSTKKKSN